MTICPANYIYICRFFYCMSQKWGDSHYIYLPSNCFYELIYCEHLLILYRMQTLLCKHTFVFFLAWAWSICSMSHTLFSTIIQTTNEKKLYYPSLLPCPQQFNKTCYYTCMCTYVSMHILLPVCLWMIKLWWRGLQVFIFFLGVNSGSSCHWMAIPTVYILYIIYEERLNGENFTIREGNSSLHNLLRVFVPCIYNCGAH